MSDAIPSGKWFVVNNDDETVIRGPFNSSETATAVRRELERHEPWSEEGNLWIVRREVTP